MLTGATYKVRGRSAASLRVSLRVKGIQTITRFVTGTLVELCSTSAVSIT
jgi:hypothetical protein